MKNIFAAVVAILALVSTTFAQDTTAPVADTTAPVAPVADTTAPAADSTAPAAETSTTVKDKVDELQKRIKEKIGQGKTWEEYVIQIQNEWTEKLPIGVIIESAFTVAIWVLILLVAAHYAKIYTPFTVTTQLIEEFVLIFLWLIVPVCSCLVWGPGLYTLTLFGLYTAAVIGTRIAYYAFVFPFLP